MQRQAGACFRLTSASGMTHHQGVEEAKVHTTVGDDADDGHAEAVVESHDAAGAGGSLRQAVSQALELGLASAHIGRQARARVVQGVHNHQGAGASEATRRHVDGEGLQGVLLLVHLGEHGLDGVLEGEVEGLGGDCTHAPSPRPHQW
jgi:hypothetical protein